MKTLTIITFLFIFATGVSKSGAQDADTTSTEFVLANSLFEAIHNIDIVSLNVLLAEGADVDSVDEAGNTPLMLASKIGNPRMMKILLAHNPNVNKRNNIGKSALMIASENGQLHIAEQLIEQGADVSAQSNDGLTAMQIALRNGHPKIMSLIENRSKLTTAR
ncbi:MAG: ankyrin repeat domain-containing protein [Balneolaceae bacterium]